jgi:hypothetical protein
MIFMKRKFYIRDADKVAQASRLRRERVIAGGTPALL